MGGAGGTAFLEPFLVDKWRVVLGDMRRASFLGDRRSLDLVGILLLMLNGTGHTGPSEFCATSI